MNGRKAIWGNLDKITGRTGWGDCGLRISAVGGSSAFVSIMADKTANGADFSIRGPG